MAQTRPRFRSFALIVAAWRVYRFRATKNLAGTWRGRKDAEVIEQLEAVELVLHWIFHLRVAKLDVTSRGVMARARRACPPKW